MSKKIKVIIKEPRHTPSRFTVDQNAVWGEFCDKTNKMISNGMVVARHDNTCPVWFDVIPYKSVTLICESKDFESVIYWCEFVHGTDSISDRKELPDNKIAIRSNYMCW